MEAHKFDSPLSENDSGNRLRMVITRLHHATKTLKKVGLACPNSIFFHRTMTSKMILTHMKALCNHRLLDGTSKTCADEQLFVRCSKDGITVTQYIR